MPKVSIIVPIYNVEPYFDECVQSLLNQTYKDIEIILVDDGSPDNCPAMCDTYAKQDARVRVIHQENQGVSVARNVGMDTATGKWFMFCDPDDWYALNAVEIMLEHAERHDCDIAIFGYTRHITKGIKFSRPLQNDFLLQDSLILENCILRSSVDHICNGRIFKKSLINNHCIRFTPNSPITQDLMFSIKSLFHSKKVFFGTVRLYHNRKVDDSSSHRYRPDVYTYYKRILDELRSFAEEEDMDIITKNKLLNNYTRMLYITGLRISYLNPFAPLKLNDRLRGMRDILSTEPWESITSKDQHVVDKKSRIHMFFIRYRLVLLHYLLLKLWWKIKQY